MFDDVILNKAASIERCLQRIQEGLTGHKQNLVANQTKQDAIILNFQHACETAIDLARYVISQLKLGVPQDCREAFTLLQTAGIITGPSGSPNAADGPLPQRGRVQTHPPDSGCGARHHHQPRPHWGMGGVNAVGLFATTGPATGYKIPFVERTFPANRSSSIVA